MGAKRELNLVLVMRATGLSVLRSLKREIRKLISEKLKNLNETKARAILLHLEGMKISEIAKILQVHKSTGGLTNSREGGKMPIPQGKKKEGKREGNKGRRNTRKNHMESKNIEEKFNVIISYSLENSEKKTENSLHKTLQDQQANRC
jgi:transposase